MQKIYVFKKLKLSKAIETSFKRNFNDNFLHVIKLKSVFINALPWWYLFVLNAVCYAIDTQTMRENFPKLLSIFKKCFSYLKMDKKTMIKLWISSVVNISLDKEFTTKVKDRSPKIEDSPPTTDDSSPTSADDEWKFEF